MAPSNCGGTVARTALFVGLLSVACVAGNADAEADSGASHEVAEPG